MMNEECIEFQNPNDRVLRGILHHGDPSQHKSLTVIVLNTGLNDMVGWHRLQVKMARYLAENGYNVLRYDDEGIGDSEGEISEESIIKIFADIESGMFVGNANSAVEYMNKRFPNDRLLYLGFCGGGLTAVHSASVNKKIRGVIDVGGPVTLASHEYQQKKDPWEVKKNVDKYRRKIFEIQPWIRFLTGKGEYGNVIKSITYFLIHKMSGRYHEHSSPEVIDNSINLNRKFYDSFELYIKSKRPILFYYGEHDAATWEFKKYFWNKQSYTRNCNNSGVTFIEVEETNHIFSDISSQQRMKQDISDWLNIHFSE